MSGPKDTIWEPARFKIRIYFPTEFNEVAPSIFFLTVPFHPNIDIVSGKPCCAILEKGWRPDFKIAEILIYLQVCLIYYCLQKFRSYEITAWM